MQVAAVFQPLCCAVGLDVAAVSGKGPLSSEAAALVQTQGQAAGSRVDVLVATPGRCGGLLHALQPPYAHFGLISRWLKFAGS
jgi:superfamily II DNA/RNA helicase